MKALSVKQPWASLIVLGHKDIENRSWSTRCHGRIFIHASAKVDEEGARHCHPHIGQEDASALQRSAIIGAVTIAACLDGKRFRQDDEWASGEGFAWVLRDPIMFADPIPCKGALMFWNIPEEFHGAVLEQMPAGHKAHGRSTHDAGPQEIIDVSRLNPMDANAAQREFAI